MKKALISFLVAFGLTVGFSFLSLAFQGALNSAFSSIALSLVGIGLFFAVFYLLANTNKVTAEKLTTIALFIGVLLGSTISVFLAWTISVMIYLSYFLWSALTLSVIQYFFPALIALLFAELRNNKLNHNLTEEAEEGA